MSAVIEKRSSNGEAVCWPQVLPVVDIFGNVSSLILLGKITLYNPAQSMWPGEVAEGE